MSADNAIIILQLKDQFRLSHMQAIENLRFSFLSWKIEDEYISTRIIENFKDEDIYLDYDKIFEYAKILANELYENGLSLEYGIITIRIDKSWSTLVDEAKNVAISEKESIIFQQDWKYRKDWYISTLSSLNSIERL